MALADKVAKTVAKDVKEPKKEETKVETPKSQGWSDWVAKARQEAFKTRKVIITYNDKKDSNDVSTAYLTCENEFFSIAKFVPLDMLVELEQCLIDTAKDVRIIAYKPEFINGKMTKNKIPHEINKYTISYQD